MVVVAMGIRGLFSYAHSNGSFWINISELFKKDNESGETSSKPYLIIDGPNIANQLHRIANLDALYGGQYQEFYESVRELLLSVISAGFVPIVVLEEIMEDRKRGTILTRRIEKLVELNQSVHNGEKIHKLPRMGHITFTQAVLDLNIEHIMCESEADPVIAALASKLNAYILSNDSDFLFTRIPGVLSIEYLSWSSGALAGSCFRLPNFLEYHKLQLWAVPFVVMMLGNDFIPPQLFEVIGGIREDAIKHLSGRKISKVLQMLTSFKTETVLLRFFQNRLHAHWPEFLRYYRIAVSSYLNPESLVRIDPTLPHYGMEYRNIREKSGNISLESLFRVAWAWGVIIRGETLAQCNIEHFQRDPATNCSLPIRIYTYSFFMGGSHLIEIVHTQSLSLKYERMELIHTLPNGCPLPDLDEVLLIPEKERLEIFLQITELSTPGIIQLKDPWRLLVFTLRYWYLHCIPHPSASLLEIITVSCFITYTHPRKEYSNYPRNINKLIRSDLLRYHQVAQWHTTQHDLYRLAMVMNLPLLDPGLFYNGRLLFQILLDKEFRESQLDKYIDKKTQLWINYLTEIIVNK